jgi:hypothetical protein
LDGNQNGNFNFLKGKTKNTKDLRFDRISIVFESSGGGPEDPLHESTQIYRSKVGTSALIFLKETTHQGELAKLIMDKLVDSGF